MEEKNWLRRSVSHTLLVDAENSRLIFKNQVVSMAYESLSVETVKPLYEGL
jgi:hypothetical protein